jgi:hypothetical protein
MEVHFNPAGRGKFIEEEEMDDPTGRKVTDEEIRRVNPEQNKFHGEWNYTIHPSTH